MESRVAGVYYLLNLLKLDSQYMEATMQTYHCLNWSVFALQQQKNVMKTTWGVLDPPVGNTRLNVVRLVASLLQSNTHNINAELINLNTMGVILVSTSFISVYNLVILGLESNILIVLNWSINLFQGGCQPVDVRNSEPLCYF